MPAESTSNTRAAASRTRAASTNGKRAPVASESVQTDGRRLRGERTRLRVLEALLDLVAKGELRPTAQQVATAAGVALRTVYHHFEDVEALRRMAFDLQVGRHNELLQEIDPSLDVDERIHVLARQLRKLFEIIGPIRRATMFDEHSSQEMAIGLRRSRVIRRQFVEQTFGPEIAALPSAEGKVLLDALDVITSWPTWFYLRDGNSLGRGPAAAERVLVLMLTDALASSPTAASSGKGRS
ncbi:MAG TPA: TetR/AcrR family transcriptional regulator [Acidimicrobiales bacterium]|nr:TetR/AcrR family transcriptional regulator [Acidimicrobiales bacterium]